MVGPYSGLGVGGTSLEELAPSSRCIGSRASSMALPQTWMLLCRTKQLAHACQRSSDGSAGKLAKPSTSPGSSCTILVLCDRRTKCSTEVNRLSNWITFPMGRSNLFHIVLHLPTFTQEHVKIKLCVPLSGVQSLPTLGVVLFQDDPITQSSHKEDESFFLFLLTTSLPQRRSWCSPHGITSAASSASEPCRGRLSRSPGGVPLPMVPQYNILASFSHHVSVAKLNSPTLVLSTTWVCPGGGSDEMHLILGAFILCWAASAQWCRGRTRVRLHFSALCQ